MKHRLSQSEFEAIIQHDDVDRLARHLDAGLPVDAELYGSRLLYAAVGCNSHGLAKLLLARGADVGIALAGAAGRSSLRMVKLLLAAGADVEVRHTADGMPPLAYAALHGRADVVKLLLDAGADPLAHGREGETALIACAKPPDSQGRANCVKLLLTAGADPGARDNYQRTALQLAEENGRKRVAAALRGAKATRPAAKPRKRR